MLDVGLEEFMPEHSEKAISKFQSLFCWMLVWKVDVCGVIASDLNISILVLLDVGLEVYKGLRMVEKKPISILVLLDVGLEEQVRLMTLHW